MENQCCEIIWTRLKSILERFETEIRPHSVGICIITDSSAYELISSGLRSRLPIHWICSFPREQAPNQAQLKRIFIVQHPISYAPTHFEVRAVSSTDLIDNLPRTILQVLHNKRASHFIDIFEAKVVAYLRMTLKNFGVSSFIEDIHRILQVCGQDGVPFDIWVLESGRSAPDSWMATFKRKSDTDQLSDVGAFFDRLAVVPEPHQYLKARFSYHVYLKSNKNISKASRTLNISRTTLHDHLRIAESHGLFADPL